MHMLEHANVQSRAPHPPAHGIAAGRLRRVSARSHDRVERHSRRSVPARLLVLLGLLVTLACGNSSDTVLLLAPAQPLGQLDVSLLAYGSSGTAYRLRSAVLMVQGPDQTLFFDTEEDPTATTLSATVTPGIYGSFLQEGWRLERADAPAAPLVATLISPNPDAFDVVAGERARLVLRFRVESDVVTTEPAGLDIAIEVEESGAPPVCDADGDCAAGEVCCSAGFLGTCLVLEPGQSCPLPDLTISADEVLTSLRVERETFAADSCAIEEGCVAQAGERRLMRFSTTTPNIGELDLVLGDPATTTGFEFAPCHGHFHFEDYARYELVDASGAIVAEGHKQAFCLLDSEPVGLPGAATRPRYHCGFQGLQRGWADTYGSNLDCQWVDVTDVDDGRYLLRISVNPERVLLESDYDNNVVEVPVTVTDTPVDPLAECSVPASTLPFRDCGWSLADGFEAASCTPGELWRVGCGCPDASCEGDPMLRVCEGGSVCASGESLALAADNCGPCPAVSFVCPASGAFSVLSAASDLQPYGCDIVSGPDDTSL
jgi:hypothetical protein